MMPWNLSIMKKIAGFVLNELLELRTMVAPYAEILDEPSLQMLISEMLDTTRIHLVGSLLGLQIMGLLEHAHWILIIYFFLMSVKALSQNQIVTIHLFHLLSERVLGSHYRRARCHYRYHFWRLMQRRQKLI